MLGTMGPKGAIGTLGIIDPAPAPSPPQQNFEQQQAPISERSNRPKIEPTTTPARDPPDSPLELVVETTVLFVESSEAPLLLLVVVTLELLEVVEERSVAEFAVVSELTELAGLVTRVVTDEAGVPVVVVPVKAVLVAVFDVVGLTLIVVGVVVVVFVVVVVCVVVVVTVVVVVVIVVVVVVGGGVVVTAMQ